MTNSKSPTIEVQQQYAYFLLPYEVEVTVNNKTKKTHRVELVTRLLDNYVNQKNLIKFNQTAQGYSAIYNFKFACSHPPHHPQYLIL